MWVVSKTKFDVVKLRALLYNALSKKIISSATQVESNGRTHLEHILDSYVNNEVLSFKDKVKFFPLKKILDIVRRAFNQSDDQFKKSLLNPTMRKILLNSLKSLEKYGLTTPQNFYSPMMVVWNFTYKCNLRCKHCYENAGILRNGNFTELSIDEKFQALDKLSRENIPTIFFSGGEPLAGEGFFEIAEAAKKMGFYLSIATNGTLFNKENAQRAKEIGFGYVAVSLDAATPEVHDRFRGMPGMWQRSINGIKNLIDAGVTTCIQYTLAKDNLSELPKMFSLLKEIGAYKLIIYNYIPVGRGEFESDPTPEDRESAYKLMFEQLDLGYHIIATTSPQFGRYCQEMRAGSVIIAHYADAKSEEFGAIADIVGGCGAGRAYCALQPDGIITPCVYMPDLQIGNIKTQEFREIWDAPLMAQFRDRSDLWGHCSNCNYKAVCGGCRARAYVYTGDIKGPDPGCIYNREYYYKAQMSKLK
ncbi:MAG: radical SAM protein [bacterium]|nr:radical SAM protein [bacterium]